ncbi:phosphoribosylformylglycinamidine synthase subunit PurS [Calditerricola satsumensis]|uniref:Phosphoribosylformylglycinamidine synthase subunit PurS n=1 Tax=Calditerricola satsumensis TaxID=373054 RepID=A0A8J3BHF4_9BACI|nr:phosphoribosylformylglycinamidine synthase subunit PurS [Calditerricola satsumensis]GGK03722.1 phosphoribosylformylglycinamidine synthase subunit PurS [Calditerricola satsumensis]
MVKARVIVMLKDGVLDPQGQATQKALHTLGYDEVAAVRVGKVIELNLDTEDREWASARLKEMCDKLLANPVIESYRIERVEG